MVVLHARLWWALVGWYHHGLVHKDMLVTCGASFVSNTAARELEPHLGAAIVSKLEGGQEMVGVAVDRVPVKELDCTTALFIPVCGSIVT